MTPSRTPILFVLLACACAIISLEACTIRKAPTEEKRPAISHADKFSAGPTLLHARSGASAYPTNKGGALIVGGGYSSGTPEFAEVYDPGAQEFRAAATREQSMPRKGVDGSWRWYGETLSRDLAPEEVLTLTTFLKKNWPMNSYSKIVPLSQNLVLAVGGIDHKASPIKAISSAVIFDLQKNKTVWSGKMLEARTGCSATLLNDGKVLIAGGQQLGSGRDGQPLDSTEIFDPKTRNFSMGPKLTCTRYQHEAIRLRDGRVLLLSGVSPSTKETPKFSDVYYPKSNTVQATGPQVFGASGQATVLLPSGNVFTCGSFVGAYNAQIFRVDNNKFIDAGPMREPRARQGAAVLGDGRVLIVGGQHVAGVSDETPYLRTTEFFHE